MCYATQTMKNKNSNKKILPIFTPLNTNPAETICSSLHCGSWFASSLKNVSCFGGENRYPSGTPTFLFKNEPVANLRVTHSIGIIWHFVEMNALSDADLTYAVLIPRHFIRKTRFQKSF